MPLPAMQKSESDRAESKCKKEEEEEEENFICE
jgi:hypothetical protein